jgi:hypothetical protein
MRGQDFWDRLHRLVHLTRAAYRLEIVTGRAAPMIVAIILAIVSGPLGHGAARRAAARDRGPPCPVAVKAALLLSPPPVSGRVPLKFRCRSPAL